MEIVIGWLVFSIVAGIIASNKGRSGGGYFLLSLLLSPLVGLILAAALPSLKTSPQAAAPAPAAHPAEPEQARRKCPDCAELILVEAKVCKHCGKRFDNPEPASSDPADLAAHYGIVSMPDGRFQYGEHRYDKLVDAVRYAQQQQQQRA